MEADGRVAVDLAALNAHVDALVRAGRMAQAQAQAERGAELRARQGARACSGPCLIRTRLSSSSVPCRSLEECSRATVYVELRGACGDKACCWCSSRHAGRITDS